MAARKTNVPTEKIEQAIQFVRGLKVMLDSDLAKLYGVETKILNKAVKRNLDRFPADFMFQLTADEAANLRFQIGTSSATYGGRRYRPYAFTEQGVAMLSSVLRSPQAVRVNIQIMRAFVRLRNVLVMNAELAQRLDEIEKRLASHDKQFGDHEQLFVSVIQEIKHLMSAPNTTKQRRIGFHVVEDEETPLTPGSRTRIARRRNPAK